LKGGKIIANEEMAGIWKAKFTVYINSVFQGSPGEIEVREGRKVS
jgi:hypothetical protein